MRPKQLLILSQMFVQKPKSRFPQVQSKCVMLSWYCLCLYRCMSPLGGVMSLRGSEREKNGGNSVVQVRERGEEDREASVNEIMYF